MCAPIERAQWCTLGSALSTGFEPAENWILEPFCWCAPGAQGQVVVTVTASVLSSLDLFRVV